MMYPLVRELAVDGIPVAVTCRVLKIARQPYYRWLADPVTDADWIAAHRANALFDAHRDDPEFGYRFLADELQRAGLVAGERRIWRLCSQQKLWSTTVRKGRRSSGKTPGPAVHDDLVQRDFTAQQPDQVWVTDITEHPTAEGTLYCAAVLDVYSRWIVGWSMAPHIRTELVLDALGMAVVRRTPQNGETILHSDHGTQYTSWAFGQRLQKAGLLGSMGSVGDCYDNAMMESFWGTLQLEVLDRQSWASAFNVCWAWAIAAVGKSRNP